MKKTVIVSLLIIISEILASKSFAQTIPYGTSIDTVTVLPNDTAYEIYYFKPTNYDSTSSPILWGIHGLGMNGGSVIGDLQAIAESRKAMIVAPTMHTSWGYGFESFYSNPNCYNVTWLTIIFKQLYRHVLLRENRGTIYSYFIGFSAGGQFISRFMLIRQIIPDSIPIKMAVSSSAYFYTFGIDTINDVNMPWPCGLSSGLLQSICDTDTSTSYFCDEQVKMYYNENYGVCVGNADTTGAPSIWPCMQPQGANRYERAKNFYHFSDSDAVVRGTTLKWQYGEVPGVDHNQNLMYNTILAGDSMPLAERLLFETPYHTVPSLAPLASFMADTTIVTLPSASVQFYNGSINASSYLWDFGDTTTSTAFNILHTYLYADTFTVMLTAISGTGCDNTVIKYSYIIVKNGVSVNEINRNSANLQIYPNPSIGQITIKVENEFIVTIEVFNCIGSKVDEIFVKGNISSYIYNSKNLNGLYFIKVKTKENVYTGKVVFR